MLCLLRTMRNQTYQQMPQMQRPTSYFAGCPVTKWLLISNIVIYFLDIFFFGANQETRGHLFIWGHFSVEIAMNQVQIWRFLTFQFLHADGMHLFGNMLAMYFFGIFAERWWGSKKFVFFYLASGIAGVLLYLILFYTGVFGIVPAYRPMVGASAGIFAILVCAAIIAPNLRVLLFFIIPVRMKTMAIGMLVFAAFMVLTNGNNAGGEAAHLGGAILGFILMKNPSWLSFLDSGARSRKPRRGKAKVREKKIRPRVMINMDDTEVDRILDKVSREGIQSLTDEEKKILLQAGGNK